MRLSGVVRTTLCSSAYFSRSESSSIAARKILSEGRNIRVYSRAGEKIAG
jgi:hypothetical protein